MNIEYHYNYVIINFYISPIHDNLFFYDFWIRSMGKSCFGWLDFLPPTTRGLKVETCDMVNTLELFRVCILLHIMINSLV